MQYRRSRTDMPRASPFNVRSSMEMTLLTVVYAGPQTTVSNVISMDDRTLKGDARGLSLRDRRYCIRYPFAADVELLDLESGAKTEGVTSDISMGCAFVWTSRPLPSHARPRLTLLRQDQKVE